MIRLSIVAGQFYPEPKEELEAMIKTMVDDNVVKEDIIGAVSPHAGYTYSGPVTGAVFSRMKLKDTVIILGPNHTGRGKPFSISTSGKWRTPFGNVEIDSELAKKILVTSRYLREDYEAHRMEHSIEVQLPFLQYLKKDIKLVPIVLSFGTVETYRDIGREIARAVKDLGRQVIIIASSDMTHYESQESAKNKDSQAIEAMLKLDEYALARKVEELKITMCGYAPAVVMLTAAKELGGTRAELVKYQTSGDATGDYSSVVGYAGILIKEMSPLVRLAHQTVENYITENKVINPPVELTPEMKEQAGVFVSIHEHGELRGCIGTFQPTTENVATEVITNAISSATRDPRFPPISAQELKDLDINVDVLTNPEPVESKEQLDPKKYGVIVESGWRKGLLLPDLEGVDSVDQQISICCAKAGIGSREKTKLYRFEVKRYV
jgi:MEMO1 family protein